MMFDEYVAWQEGKRKVNRSEASKARTRAYQKKYQAERRERMKAKGLCVTCGKPNDNGMARCDRCLERTRVKTATSGMEEIRTQEVKTQEVVLIPIKTLEQVAMEARAAGMSYGQYVALTEVKRNG